MDNERPPSDKDLEAVGLLIVAMSAVLMCWLFASLFSFVFG